LKNQKRVTGVGTNWYKMVLKISVLDLFCAVWVCSFVIKNGGENKTIAMSSKTTFGLIFFINRSKERKYGEYMLFRLFNLRIRFRG
jgi:hypothetical protein